MSALLAFIVACAFALAPPAVHHCGKHCHERLAEQCAKEIVGGARC